MQAAKYMIITVSALAAAALAALTLPGAVFAASSVLDNPWTIVSNRAKKAGRLLAQAIIERAHGNRPVTLIGWSLGGKVAYHCLKAIYRHNQVQQEKYIQQLQQQHAQEGQEPIIHSPDGVMIENAFILGGACGNESESWRKCKSVVAGRLVNGYSEGDWYVPYLIHS
jgi:surfactin synthase thioesterase subunit